MTRLAMLHRNVPNMIGKITTILGEDNVNIANLMNKARGDHAYTLIDLNQPASDEAMEKIRSLEGVRRLRFI